MLHDEYAEAMGWQEHGKEFFLNEAFCSFCANVQMYTHNQYIRREKKGIKLPLDNVEVSVKRNKFFRRLRGVLHISRKD
jgi:hypothetical protein